MKIKFSVYRSERIEYEADVPEDFDSSDMWELVELADYATEVDRETTHLFATSEGFEVTS